MRITDFATEVLNIVGRGGAHVDTALKARLEFSENNPGIINRAIMRIARNWPWKELRVLDKTTYKTVADQEWVDISGADPIRYIVSVRLMDGINSRKLHRIDDIRLVDGRYADPTHTPSRRSFGYVEDQLILDDVQKHCLVLIPIPDGEYEVWMRYSKWPEVYGNEDTPILKQLDDVILNLSISMTYAAIAEYPQSVFWYTNQYLPLLEEAVRLEVTQPDWDKEWLGHTRPPDLGRSADLNPWQDPFRMRS